MPLVVFIFLLFSMITLFLKYRKAINPINIIFIYLYGMLFLSSISALGISPPSTFGISIFILSFFSANIGALIAKKRKRIPTDATFYANKKLLIYAAIFICIAPLSFEFLKTISFIISSGFDQFVIKTRFSDSIDAANTSSSLTAVINIFSKPIARVTLLIGVAALLRNEGKSLAFIGMLSLFIFSIINLKRMDLAAIFIILCFGMTIQRKDNDNEKRKETTKIEKYSPLFLMAFIIVGTSALIKNEASLFDIIMRHGLGYHSYGFLLFDHALNDPLSHLHDTVFPGKTIFSSIDFFIDQTSNLLNFEWTYDSSMVYSKELSKHIFLGYSSFSGNAVSPNAFYTSLFPIYRDTGLVGIVFFSYLFGFLFSREYLTYRHHGNLRSLVWVLFFSWLGYGSLMTGLIMRSAFWLTPLALFLIFRLRIRSKY